MRAVILIHNVYDLQNMSKDLNASYALANDIDASVTRTWNSGAGFIPIGNESAPFNGTFDGNGYKIINLWIKRSSEAYVGLFGYISESARIENVSLVNVSVSGSDNVGGLVGENDGTVNNTYAMGNVRGYWDVGGLVGYNNGGTVSNSYATGNVSGSDYVGGLVGYNWGTVNNTYATGNVSGSGYVGGLVGENRGTVNNTYATGNVSGSGNDVGGLVGWNNGGTVNNSYATGNVSGNGDVGGLVGYNGGTVNNSYSTGNVSGDSSVGGLVGESHNTVNNSYATGNVNGNSDVGGLVGVNDGGTVSNSYATGNVSGSGYVGGFVGWNDGGTVSNSYATGNVSGSDCCVGGLVGRNYGTVSNSYSTGNVSGSDYVGGVVGYNWGTVTASFWDVETSGIDHSAGGTGLTTAQMKNITTFLNAGWDFNHTWGIWDGVTYPFLRWQGLKSVASAPLNLNATGGDGYVNLTWESPEDSGGLAITGYRIYRNGVLIATVPATQLWYNDTDVVSGQTYVYYVTAVNAAGESPKSNEVSATPGETIPEMATTTVLVAMVLALLFVVRRRR